MRNAHYCQGKKTSHSCCCRYGRATALAIDPSKNIIVTGFTWSFSDYYTGVDYITIKYDNDGNEMWVTRYDGAYDFSYGWPDDYAKAIAVDTSGNIFVTGISFKELRDIMGIHLTQPE